VWEGALDKPFAAYIGDEPYVFVCYAHDDRGVVYPEIAWLHEQAINLWYDEGISAGKNWRAAIGDSLLGASHVVFYISERSLTSDHCNREINLALDEGKDIVPIYLEDVELTSDLKVGLNRVQAIHRHELDEQEYRDELSVAMKISPAALVEQEPKPKKRSWVAPLTASVVIVLIAIVGLIYREFADEPALEPIDDAAQTSVLANSVAVLPFKNLSPDPAHAYFAAGIHEETLNQLAKIEALAVIAQGTVLNYADSTQSVPEIARELNVESVLEGSVRYAGNRVRLTAQLIDGRTGTQLWSNAYDRDLTDVFAIQTDIARHITTALKAEFSVAEQTSIGARPTDNIEAYAAYVRANSMFGQLLDLGEVHASLDEAIALDLSFAQALAFKAHLHGFEIGSPIPGNVITSENQRLHVDAARRYAQRALAIDPDQAGAYLALSLVAEYERRWDDDFDAILHAHALNPNNERILGFLAIHLIDRNRLDEGIALFEKAIALNPQSWALPYFFSISLLWTDRLDYAADQARQSIALAPQLAYGYVALAQAAGFAGNIDTAVVAAQEAEQRSIDPEMRARLMEIYSLAVLPEEVARLLIDQQRAHEISPLSSIEWMISYRASGDYESAVKALADGVDQSIPALIPVFMARMLRFNHDHWWFDPFRDDARFTRAVAKVYTPLD
jgi:TolB-like protein